MYSVIITADGTAPRPKIVRGDIESVAVNREIDRRLERHGSTHTQQFKSKDEAELYVAEEFEAKVSRRAK